MKKTLAALALATTATFSGAAPADAALIINSITSANSGAPKAKLRAGGYTVNNVRVTPFNVSGTLDGDAVSLYTFCVDIFQTIHSGTYDVVSLTDFVGGDALKAGRIAALISNQGSAGTVQHDAAVQLALWELLYEDNGTSADLTKNVFRVPTISDPAARTLANQYADLARTSWMPAKDIVINVAKNGKYQDQLFWSYAPAGVPEPATWAMMIIGFGAIGSAMRSKRVKTRVSFA